MLPHAKASLSILGLLRRHIEELTITEPKITLALKDTGAERLGARRLSLPVSIKRLRIKDAELIVAPAKGAPLHVASINCTFDEMSGGKGRLEVSALLPELAGEVSLEAIVDIRKLNIDSGRIDIGSIDLATLSSMNIALFKGRRITGSLSSTIDIVEEESGGMGVVYTGIFTDAGIGGAARGTPRRGISGRINARVSISRGFGNLRVRAEAKAVSSAAKDEDRHELAFDADYDIKGRALVIEEATLSSTLFGSASLIGSLTDLPSDKGAFKIDLALEKVSLSNIKRYLLDPLGIGPGGFTYGGSVSGRMNIEGSLAERADFNSELAIADFGITAGSLRINPKNKHLKLSTRGFYGIRDDHLELEFIKAQLKGYSPLKISGKLDGISSGTPEFDLVAKIAGVSIDKIPDFISALLPEGLQRLDVNGRLSATAEVRGSRGHHKGKTSPAHPYSVEGSASLALTDWEFASPDGEMMGEGVDLDISGGFKLSLPEKKAVFDISASAGGFEVLIGSLYGDFIEKSCTLSLNGEYAGGSDSLAITQARVGLADIGSLQMSADITGLTTSPAFDTTGRLEVPSLGKVYNPFIKETFQDDLPFLSTLSLDGGASVRFKAAGSFENFDASGEIKVSHADITDEGSGFSVKGVEIALPIDITYPEAKEERAARRFGSLSIESISWNALHIADLGFYPAIWQNALVFKEDLLIPVFNGLVVFKDLNYKDIFAANRELNVTIVMDDIDLSEVSASVGLPAFSGSLSGIIPRAKFAAGSFTTEGEVILRLFGGELKVSGIALDDVFTPIASIRSNIEFKEIDLGRMTDVFEFGRVTGVVQGYVRGLVITGGQPESFEAAVETVARRGVGQKISVKALKTISIFGTGSTGSIFSTGIHRFFQEYRYSKMGFSGRLKNDDFFLTGIETDGAKGYLVKGSILPPRVDVLSYRQKISFRQMVERIKRVQTVE